jgi:hypothetical protein
MIINVYWPSCKVPVILVIFLMKLEFSQHIFKKYSIVKFNENSSSGSQVAQCRWMDRQTDMNPLYAVLQTHLKMHQLDIWTMHMCGDTNAVCIYSSLRNIRVQNRCFSLCVYIGGDRKPL